MRTLSRSLKSLTSPEAIAAVGGILARLGSAAGRHLVGLKGASNEAGVTLPLRGECRPSRVYLVGAGSGDVELLTLKAARLLMQADAVVYDRLVGDGVLALIPAGRERYYVGKASGHHSVPQAEIGELLVRLAAQGKSVVRLKGGDPGVFGRMGEELAALAEAGVSAEIVPGITAASAACAGMGIPLTDRGHAQQLRFVTAQQCRADGAPDWEALARRDETLVLYMGLTKVEAICAGLRGAGGYQMFGITPMPIYDPQQKIKYLRDFMVFFRPGDIVKWKPIDRAQYDATVADVEAGKFAPRMTNVTFSLDEFHKDIDGTNRKLEGALNGH